MANRINKALTRRQQELTLQAERAAAGVPSDFVGPTTTEGLSPEQSAAAALAKARFYSQQLEQFQPPRPEQTGLSKFSRGPIGMALSYMSPSASAVSRKKDILAGGPEERFLEERFKQSMQGADIAQTQQQRTELAFDRQQKQAETSRQQAEDEATKKALGRGQSGLTGGAKALAEAAAIRGDTGAYAQAFGLQHQILQNRKLIDEGKRSEEAYSFMKEGFSRLQETGQADNPRALGALQLQVGVLGNDQNAVGEASKLFSGIASDEALQKEREKSTQELARRIREQGQEEAKRLLDTILDRYQKLAPVGADLDTVMAAVLDSAGVDAEVSDRVTNALELLREPLGRSWKIQQALDAAKTLEDKRTAISKAYGEYYDEKTGEAKGWLKMNAGRESGFIVGGKPVLMKEYYDKFFRDKQKELLKPVEGKSGGVTKLGGLQDDADFLGELKQDSDASAAQGQAQVDAEAKAEEERRKSFGLGGTSSIGRLPAPVR